MGALARLFGTRKHNEPQHETNNHAIRTSAALMPTDPRVIRPGMAGNWSSIASNPIVEDPRYFYELESKALVTMARAKVKGAKDTVKAYQALSAIEQSDATVHTAHRGYQAQMAKGEAQKLKSNAQLAKTLHGLRPGYAAAQLAIAGADQQASNRVAELKSKYMEAMQ